MNRTNQGLYLCKAASVTAREGRCRNKAGLDGFCHNPHQLGDWVAEPPAVVVLMLWLSNERLHNEFYELEFPFFERQIGKSQERHEAEAALIQRSFHTYNRVDGETNRKIGDTGAAVFGKGGLQQVVDVSSLVEGMVEAGFTVDGLPHGELTVPTEKGGKHGIRMVVNFRRLNLDEEAHPRRSGAMDEDQRGFFHHLMYDGCWKRFDVFDNVPKYYVKHEGQILQFHPYYAAPQPGKQVPVHMLRPLVADQIVELDWDVYERAVRFSTSTINCRIPFFIPERDNGMVRVTWGRGHWAAYRVAA